MSEQKLDLILEVVSDIKVRQEKLEKTVGTIITVVGDIKNRQENLEITAGEINSKVDKLSTEFSDFRTKVIKSFAKVQNRFAVLEKQMVAIGIEIKLEIKAEIAAVGARIDRLEKQIIFDRNDTLENREEIREIKKRLTQIESNIGLSV